MNIGLIIGILILIFDFAISIWNSYNAGKIATYRKGLGTLVFFLGGFLPVSYVIATVITFILAYLGYISSSTTVFILSFDFLFFGLAIIMWGVIATTLSIVATVKGRSWTAGIITVYNAFATIADAWEYITGFLSAWKNVRRAIDSSDFSVIDVIAILAISLGIGYIISYVAYKEGIKSESGYYTSRQFF
ncbi:hypothetical protein [Stygiolobus caldivivus]|uniref:Uncharacterized protein n=1 Tax=Stygiolobus caldivivus TaxID=2824673 RepID=A0A8D5U8M5_9CREN|nr:hypothetical protein [Stygiolobus caldivivus]BCU71060.1 hypothetical protein KN1_23570 [Stygiolobus caldivivus]